MDKFFTCFDVRSISGVTECRLVGLEIELDAPQIASGDVLEDGEVELGDDREDMVEHVGLHGFVERPVGLCREEIDLDRQARLGGLEVADKAGHILVNRGQLIKIADQVGAEDAEVCLPAAVDGDRVVDLPLVVIGGQLFLLLVDISGEERDAAVFGQHLWRAEADAVHVDVDGSLDAAAARFLHATPVLESVADEGVGRDGGDGIVEVAHLDGVERHLDDCSVGAIFLHRDPVARAQHVVGRELYAGDEAEDRILEDQHQDGRRGAESGEERDRRLVDDDADDEDRPDEEERHLQDLDESLDRLVFQDVPLAVDLLDDIERRVQETERDGNDVDRAGLLQEGEQLRHLVLREGDGQQDVGQDGGNDVHHLVDDLAFDDQVVPLVLRLAGDALEGVEHDAAANIVDAEGDKDYGS